MAGRENKNWDSKEKGWEQVQIKAFTSWLNGYLVKRDQKVEDISTDMSDGVKLINFLELLTEQKVKQKYVDKPPSRIEKIQNLHIALTFLEKDLGFKSAGASAEDFADNNLKMILGFFWSLFKKYRIQTIKQDDKSSEQGLLLWVKKTTDGYRDVNIESYKHSFRNGLPFLALCDKFIEDPNVLNYDNFSKENQVENLGVAFDLAEKHLGVPKLLDPLEVSEGNVDERSLVLYVSLYFHAFVAHEQQKALLAEKDNIAKEKSALQGTLEERAKLASQLQEQNDSLKSQLNDANSELEALKAKLAQEQAERARLEEERARLAKELEEQKKRSSELEESKLTLEGIVSGLNGQVAELTTKFESESSSRQKEREEKEAKDKLEVSGLGVLKKNLEEHLEDLYRWQKYLDLDTESEVDFSGEIRPQILLDITKENFETQLEVLSKKLNKENDDLRSLLSIKEAEKKSKKDADQKKKERQQKNKV
jgi:hypothetical protein